LIIFASLIAMAILGGVATWAFIGRGNSTLPNSVSVPPGVNKSTPANATGPPDRPAPAPAPVAEPAATRTDSSAVNAEVTAALDEWLRTMLAEDLEAHLRLYAESLSVYYLQRNVSLAFVRQTKAEWFQKWTVITMSRANLRTETDSATGEVVTTFDKTFNTQANGRSRSGLVQTELRWKRVNGAWRVSGERDPHIYYINR
jgi:ketosteroid isomerase-like protein